MYDGGRDSIFYYIIFFIIIGVNIYFTITFFYEIAKVIYVVYYHPNITNLEGAQHLIGVAKTGLRYFICFAVFKVLKIISSILEYINKKDI